MKLYEYAVIFNPLPTKDENERGEKPKASGRAWATTTG